MLRAWKAASKAPGLCEDRRPGSWIPPTAEPRPSRPPKDLPSTSSSGPTRERTVQEGPALRLSEPARSECQPRDICRSPAIGAPRATTLLVPWGSLERRGQAWEGTGLQSSTSFHCRLQTPDLSLATQCRGELIYLKRVLCCRSFRNTNGSLLFIQTSSNCPLTTCFLDCYPAKYLCAL